MPSCEIPRILRARRISAEQNVDEGVLGAETCQQSKIDIPCHARFAPSLNGDPTDEARAPALSIAEVLKLAGGLKEVDHRRSFANHSCISIIPDDCRGGIVRVA